jgi:SAM-dependent methyltransferase
MFGCRRCGVAYLDPRPTPASISRAYAAYYTHASLERPSLADMTPAKRLQRRLANGYRNWRYGTADHPATILGVPVAYAMPTARALIDSDFRNLPRRPGGRRVLDVGSGSGAFLRWARSAGWDAAGVEPDPAAVTTARENGLNVHLGTAADLREMAAYDVVTLSHVFEHVHDPRGLLADLHRLLKPGGILWLDTPNISSLGHQTYGPHWIGLDPPRHLIVFNFRTLRALLESSGFRIVRRVPRFEVGRLTYAVSESIRAGVRHPLNDWQRPLALRARAYRDAWRVRLNPDSAEFLTVIAARLP